LMNNEQHLMSIVANSEDACLMFIEKDKFMNVMNIQDLIKENSIVFPTEHEIIQKIQVIERSLHMKKISFLNATNTNFLPSSFRDFYMDNETIKIYPWVRNIEEKHKLRLAQAISKKPENEVRAMKFPVVGTEVKYLNLREYTTAQRIKDKALGEIAEDIIIKVIG